MKLLDKIYQDYHCTSNYGLSVEIEKYLERYNYIDNPEVLLKRYMSAFFLQPVYLWSPVKSNIPGRLPNPNCNYIIIPKDKSKEIHILIYRKHIKRIKAWDLSLNQKKD